MDGVAVLVLVYVKYNSLQRKPTGYWLQHKQDAQLLQRDRAAGCVSFSQKWMELGENILRTLFSTTVT